MRINTNVAALNTSRNSKLNTDKRVGSVKKLSSGMKLNGAADDAAGVAISEKMRAQFRGLDVGSKNSMDAISFVQAADGAMEGVHDMLGRMRELGIQAASDVNQNFDREAIQAEIDEVKENIREALDKMAFNGIYVFKGGSEGAPDPAQKEIWIQTGGDDGSGFPLEKPELNLNNMGIAVLSVGTQQDASEAIGKIDTASRLVSMNRSRMGAYQNRLEQAMAKSDVIAENTRTAESRIRDVDMAKETTEMVKSQIIGESSTSMQAQVNALPQSVLQLLGG